MPPPLHGRCLHHSSCFGVGLGHQAAAARGKTFSPSRAGCRSNLVPVGKLPGLALQESPFGAAGVLLSTKRHAASQNTDEPAQARCRKEPSLGFLYAAAASAARGRPSPRRGAPPGANEKGPTKILRLRDIWPRYSSVPGSGHLLRVGMLQRGPHAAAGSSGRDAGDKSGCESCQHFELSSFDCKEKGVDDHWPGG